MLFSYTLLGKEPRIIPRQPPESIGRIYSIPIDQLHPHPDNPFGIRDDPSMMELIDSVKKHGVLVPAIARPKPDGGYELVAGHRRQRASQLAGLDSMPVIVMNLDDHDTIIQLVDSNIQRENILPSERAKAYKLRMEAVKKKAGRPQKEEDRNSPKISANFRSDDSIGELAGVSGDTIRNYISLTNLIPELMEMVDEKKIALSPAYQIAALPQESQSLLYDTIESEQATPSLSQAQRIRKLAQNGKLNEDSMLEIMMEQKKPERNDISSVELDERKRYIEVKTTISSKPLHFKRIHLTKNEWNTASSTHDRYYIYRLLLSKSERKLFLLQDPVGLYKKDLIDMVPGDGADITFDPQSVGRFEELLTWAN